MTATVSGFLFSFAEYPAACCAGAKLKQNIQKGVLLLIPEIFKFKVAC